MARRPTISISPSATKAARAKVAAAIRNRSAARSKRHSRLAEYYVRLAEIAARHRKEVSAAQRRVGGKIPQAVRQSAADLRASEKIKQGRSFLAESVCNRPLRIFVEAGKPTATSKVATMVRQALRLSSTSIPVNVEHLFPRLVKKRKDLRRHMVLELGLNRRRGMPLAMRIADAIRRTGSFVSVRVEGMRSGLNIGSGTPQTGPNFEMTRPDRLDWHLTDPSQALLDDPADGDDQPGAIDVYGAWDVLGAAAGTNGATAGQGIVIGHPDSGYQPHVDYPLSQVDTDQVYDAFLDASPAFYGYENLANIGRHPFQPTRFPYFVMHGTFTASVIAAPQNEPDRNGDEMVGVAPGATILPLRCVDTVILAGDLEVVRAIEHAVWANVDVISISLGGAPNPAMREAIIAALENDIIVVAAAGQGSGADWLPNQVVAPAAWPEVIAVGGSIGPRVWYGCFNGPEVDFCAPAVDIVHATFNTADTNDLTNTVHSNGTSFATAMTAGVAALWLQHHGGRQAISNAVPGRSVQQVFRHLARKTAYVPMEFDPINADVPWPASSYGSGILHARRLLEEPLPDPEDVPGINRFPPPNIYVAGGGLAAVDLNGRPVLDGIIMLQNLPGAAMDFLADLTAGTSFNAVAPNMQLANWLGGLGTLDAVSAGMQAADELAGVWEETLAAAASVGGEVGEWLGKQAEDAEEAWNEAQDALDEAIDEAEEALEDFAEDTSDFIEDTTEEASETGSEIVEDIVDAFGSLFG